jgi:plasmid stabilization system protein ParE
LNRFRVEYTLTAAQEVERAYLWIRKRAPAAAEKWLADLIVRVEALGVNPLRHPLAAESKKFPMAVRVLLFRKKHGQFRIYYTVAGERVVILTVRRSTRRPLEASDLPD